MFLTSLLDLTGAYGWVAMLAPWVLLALAVLVGVFGWRRGAARTPPTPSRPPVEGEGDTSAARPTAGAADRGGVAGPATQRLDDIAAPQGDATPPAGPPVPAPPAGAAPAGTAQRPAAPAAGGATAGGAAAPAAGQQTGQETPADATASPAPAGTIEHDDATATAEEEAAVAPDVHPREVQAAVLHRLEGAIAEAEERYDDAAVARLCIDYALAARGNGAERALVATHLRRAVVLAMRLKDDETHASARLELGDLAAEQGDTTTACEHWQIARRIFWDRQEVQLVGETDRRMTRLGCPTDWVLTDF